jgi:hypothetical protein
MDLRNYSADMGCSPRQRRDRDSGGFSVYTLLILKWIHFSYLQWIHFSYLQCIHFSYLQWIHFSYLQWIHFSYLQWIHFSYLQWIHFSLGSGYTSAT